MEIEKRETLTVLQHQIGRCVGGGSGVGCFQKLLEATSIPLYSLTNFLYSKVFPAFNLIKYTPDEKLDVSIKLLALRFPV